MRGERAFEAREGRGLEAGASSYDQASAAVAGSGRLRRFRTVMVGGLGAAVVLGVSFAVLEVGLAQPTGAARYAVRLLSALVDSRGTGAVLVVDGRRLVARCGVDWSGRTVIRLSDHTRLLVEGTRIYSRGSSTDPVDAGRSRAAARPGELLVAEADLAGSHRLLARELTARLDRLDVPGRLIRYAGRPAYELLLSRRPEVVLVAYRRRLKPIAIFYRSRTLVASSRLFRQVYARRGGPGC